MKKFLKRNLTLLLAIVMCASVFVTPGFAVEEIKGDVELPQHIDVAETENQHEVTPVDSEDAAPILDSVRNGDIILGDISDEADKFYDVGDKVYKESENNNDFAYANIIYNDYTVHAEITGLYDVDVYVFTLSKKSTITFSLISDYSTILVGLYNSAGDIIHATDSYYDGGYYFNTMAGDLNAGTYYIVVIGDDATSYKYRDYIFYFAYTTTATHTHSYTSKVVKPTCTAQGYTLYTCSCGNSYKGNYTNALGHSYGSWTTVTAATCYSTGVKKRTCTRCSVSETGTIAVTSHKPGSWIVDSEPTCTENGSQHNECTMCGDIVSSEIIPAQHTPSAWIFEEETCTKYKECTVCGELLDTVSTLVGVSKITSCYNEVGGVQLAWNAVSGAEKYKIYRKLPKDVNWEVIMVTSALTYQDSAVAGNTVYQYKIQAVDGEGKVGDYTAQRECRFIATPTLVSRENAVGGVTITWTKVAGATSYRIYRRGAGVNYWYYLGDFPASKNTFTDLETANYFPDDPSKNSLAKPKSGNYYRYTVRASYDGKDSAGNAYTIYSGFDTVGLYLKYVATPKLTGIANVTDGLQIKWNAVAGGGPVEYRVYRRGAGSTYWYYLGTTKSTSWVDSGVKVANGGYYRYTVRAVAGTNGSGWYSAFDTTGLYLMRLANPNLLSATSASSGITVKWSAIKGSSGYYVYRKTSGSGWTKIATVTGTNNTSYLDKTAKKGTTYTYTVRAVYGTTQSYFNSGISCYDKY